MSTQSHSDHSLPGPEDIVRVEMPNGIVVLVRENTSSPAVVVYGSLRCGALLEPPEKAGLASFHGDMLTRGTAHHSFAELYEEIESIGASLDVGADGHLYGFESKSLAEDLPLMLDLLAEVLREPTFPEEHIEKVRGQIMTALQMRAFNTHRMANLKFAELAYPAGHPYRLSLSGYPETVAAITRDDIVNFQTNLGPRGAIIVIVGAVKARDAIRMVESSFGDWQNPHQPPMPSAPAAPRLTEVHKAFTAIPGKTQSDIVLGFPGPARNSPDFQAARIANSILGVFGLMGRLGDNVRESQGLAYYSYSHLAGGPGPGPWKIDAGTDPANVGRAIASIREEIRRIVEEPVSADELADNKTFFKGQLLLSLETNDGVAGSLQTMETYGLGMDYLQRYPDMIDAITIEDVQTVAARYLDPDAYAVSVAGPENGQP